MPTALTEVTPAEPDETPPIGDALEADQYRASLHRRIYLATGDPRYRAAALPWDDLLQDFRQIGKEILADFNQLLPRHG
ncbi:MULTISPECIES: hypothetical protein [unclassified Dietzia]|uniref:hypothetical protein n=1 Tax=unclassified Dietzia TaxID=2617939 RepID=UPI0015F83E20|nr:MULTISPECIES: hypothetical protein [unclassified Dietzia]MBB1022953.1 hypothetical protein [Dietzia sp. DQ12-76]MBB1026459.1 hypothetical protein [Dietzia sp. DQ11-38-2]